VFVHRWNGGWSYWVAGKHAKWKVSAKYKIFLLGLCKAHRIGNVIEVEAAMIENSANQRRLLTLYWLKVLLFLDQ